MFHCMHIYTRGYTNSDLCAQGFHLGREALPEMPVHDPAEYQLHSVVIELVDGECVEVSEEPWSDGVATTSRRTHGCYQNDIHQIDL